MPTQHFAYRKILETLAEHDVKYILIGGVCAVAHGAPVTTFDVDICYSMATDNIRQVMAALEAMKSYHREPGNRRLPPDRAALERGGPALFTTDHGSLDLLGIVADTYTYEELLPHTISLSLSAELKVPALTLEKLIDVKEETGRPKDAAHLPLLKATLKSRSDGSNTSA